jgi:hypothetical protein
MNVSIVFPGRSLLCEACQQSFQGNETDQLVETILPAIDIISIGSLF